jgi:hypothetical protein
LQALPAGGHCDAELQGAPALVPPEHRWPFRPPQMPVRVEQKPPVQTPLSQSPATVHGRPLHVPLGQTLAAAQAFPAFVPPTQRPETGQSAFALHAFAVELLHVSHMHLFVVNPTARQFGLAAESVFVRVPVEFVRSMFSVAMMPPVSGGQSRLVLFQKRFGDVPFTSQV